MDERQALIALNMIDGLGSVKINRLIGHFKSAINVFSAFLDELLDIDGIGENIAFQIKNFNFENLKKEMQEAEQKNIRIITICDNEYPQILKNIYDPPVVLYIAGKGFLNTDLNLGIVGTRAADDYAEKTLEKIIKEASESGINLAIISGMARGVDAMAHINAIKNNIFTIAVLGYGLGTIYPFEKNSLVNDIFLNGTLVSEFPLHYIANRQSFPRRNRVISGLSNCVLVVEAGEKSGALITADCALEQGRDVFAVPGNIFSEKSKGTNNLIKQGAKLVDSFYDILEEYKIKYERADANNNKQEILLSDEEKKIFDLLDYEKKHIDNILIESNIDINKLSSILTVLEMKGLVKQLSGKNFIKV